MAARDGQTHLSQEAETEAFELLGREPFQSLLLNVPGLVVGLFGGYRRRRTIEQEDQAQAEQDRNRH